MQITTNVGRSKTFLQLSEERAITITIFLKTRLLLLKDIDSDVAIGSKIVWDMAIYIKAKVLNSVALELQKTCWHIGNMLPMIKLMSALLSIMVCLKSMFINFTYVSALHLSLSSYNH